MTRCRFGYPERPGSKIVFFCDDEATDTFTQLVSNSGGCMINVPVCDAHAEHLVVLAGEELLRTQGVTRAPLVFPTADSVPTYLAGRLVTRSGVTYGRHHPTNEVWWRVGADNTLTDEFIVLHRLPAEEWPLTEASPLAMSAVTPVHVDTQVDESVGNMGRKPDCPREALVQVNVLRRGGYLAVCWHCKWDGTTYDEYSDAARDRDAHNVVEVVEDEQIRLDTEVETYDIRTVGGEHVTTVVREVTRVIEHEHTDAECGHRVYDLEMEGATACSHCGEYYGNTRWCPHRCQVTHDEIVASVIEAEKNGDAPVFADETRQDEETPDDRMPDWEGNTPWIP